MITDKKMQLEYLFSNEESKSAITEYINSFETQPNISNKYSITTYMKPFIEPDKWTLLIEINSQSFDAARDLSEINDNIIKFKPLVLTNDSSAYFNRRLFPVVNIFERKLRKILYLKCTLSEKSINDKVLIEKSKSIINNIVGMTFGEIYELLFTDNTVVKQFNEKVKKRISSKAYYQKVLSEIPEVTIWDTVMGISDDDYIKNNFLDLIEIRNGIMHAQNITYSDYQKQNTYFEKAIDYLDNAIENVLKYPASAEIAETTVNAVYNKINESTLDFIERIINQNNASIKEIANDLHISNPLISKYLKGIETNNAFDITSSENNKDDKEEEK